MNALRVGPLYVLMSCPSSRSTRPKAFNELLSQYLALDINVPLIPRTERSVLSFPQSVRPRTARKPLSSFAEVGK